MAGKGLLIGHRSGRVGGRPRELGAHDDRVDHITRHILDGTVIRYRRPYLRDLIGCLKVGRYGRVRVPGDGPREE